MTNELTVLFLWVCCYVVGSLPFGLIVSLMRGVDIRTQGSHNIGATNVGRVLGRRVGLLVFTMDMLKGFVPTLLVGQWLHSEITVLGPRAYAIWSTAAFLCVCGHIFPVFLRFKGGKGVATALGSTLGVYPLLSFPVVLCLAVWGIVTRLTRYVSVGSLVSVSLFPVLVLLLRSSVVDEPWHNHWPVLVYAVVVPTLLVFRHRDNIGRLRAGSESRIEATK